MLKIVWIMYFVGMAYAYLSAEAPKPFPGNFFWSTEISGFLLFAASCKIFLLEIDAFQTTKKSMVLIDYLRNIKMVIPGVFLLHQFSSGILMYVLASRGSYFW
jgi:hypothetical protein